METLEELKAIIAGKPEGATHACIESGTRYYFKVVGLDAEIHTGDGWLCYSGCALPDLCGVRFISDIERIIELMERVKSGYEAYTRIEAVKQRYNAENKSKAELLLEAEILLRSGTQEHCNILADNIIEALK